MSEGEGRAPRGGPAETAGAVLRRVLAESGLQRRLEERRVLELWPQVAGERIARCSRPVDLADGVLTLEADNAVWRQELTLMAPLIVQRFNQACGAGAVREIRWHRAPTRSRRPGPGR